MTVSSRITLDRENPPSVILSFSSFRQTSWKFQLTKSRMFQLQKIAITVPLTMKTRCWEIRIGERNLSQNPLRQQT